MKYGELNLRQVEAVVNKLGGMVGVEKLLADHLKIVPVEPAEPKKLLELVTTIKVGDLAPFDASAHFKVDTKKAAVRIAWFGDNFKKHFLRKEEGASEAVDLKVHKLVQSSLDAPIMKELGDAKITTLAQMWEMLGKQGKGEDGPLLTNGWANIFYIKDADGNLWAVYARWDADAGGWYVEADSVGFPDRWHDGFQVVSR